MKPSLPIKTILCILNLLFCVSLQAESENLVVNGDFESGKEDAFWSCQPWYNIGKGNNQGAGARTKNGLPISGSYSAPVNDGYDPTEDKYSGLAHSQKTTHTIKEGDSYTLAYDWYPGNDYWQRTTDTIRFVLFATSNDAVGGPRVWSSELTSEFFDGAIHHVKGVVQTTTVVNAEAVGKKLFIVFYGVDKNFTKEGNRHWAMVDNIVLKVAEKTSEFR
jgi:hypothetical protein